MSCETGKAVSRRLHDHRFITEYFVGHGIDIGAGDDGLDRYQRFFPGIQSMLAWDRPNGDAQYLGSLADASFDFAVSSHCLEHMQDPGTAMYHWLRVIRPNGHLVITVPDEDMYEQTHWPSIYNHDHKFSFTVYKRHSWSPVSVNILDLLRPLAVRIKKIELLDHYFDPTVSDQDQTRGWSESAIELVLQKQ